MHELRHIICEPHWTSKAELSIVFAILERILDDLCLVERMQGELVDSCWKIEHKCK
jgi:hypothetical protein